MQRHDLSIDVEWVLLVTEQDVGIDHRQLLEKHIAIVDQNLIWFAQVRTRKRQNWDDFEAIVLDLIVNFENAVPLATADDGDPDELLLVG